MTPKYFTQRLKEYYPVLHDFYATTYNLSGKKSFVIGGRGLYIILMDTFVDENEYTDIIGAKDAIDGYGYGSTNEIKLDFFYKYIEDNEDMIMFRLL